MSKLRFSVLAVAAAVACGCKEEGTIDIVGGGPADDGRLTADLYTWDCADGSDEWMGVHNFEISLEFVPDEVSSRALPAEGSCSYGLSMFALDTVTEGAAIPYASGNPKWRTSSQDGELEEIVDGLWWDDVDENFKGCEDLPETSGGGIEVYDSGILDSVATPDVGEVEEIVVSENWTTGIPFGAEGTISWTASGWDETWVQMRRMVIDTRTGRAEAVETATCNATGDAGFTLDADLWSYFEELREVDYNYLYVGFSNKGLAETSEGQKMGVSIRALHRVGVNAD